MSIGCGIGGGDTGTGGFDGQYQKLAGSTASAAAAGKAYLFLDTENDDVLTLIDESGALYRIDEFIDEAQATSETLETNYPAADNKSYFGWVAGTTSENGLYQSNGTSWVKLLDNSGDRSELWDYETGLIFSGTNDISGTAGTAYWKYANGTDIAVGANPVSNAFDDNTSTTAADLNSDTTDMTNSYVYKEFSSLTPKIGKITFTNGPFSRATTVEPIAIDSGDNIVNLTILSHTGDGSASSTNVSGLTASGEFTITIQDPAEYKGYGMRITQAEVPLAQVRINEIAGQIVTDLTASVDCVNSINKLYNGAGRIQSSAITANTTIDETYGTVPVDATSGAITITLPASDDTAIPAGKKYTIIKTDSSANAVTIDGDGTETINGSTTIVLTSQYESVDIQLFGSGWVVASRASEPIYGNIYVQGNSTGQTTNATADTFDKITQFATDGLSSGCTNSATNDQITVLSAGTYRLDLHASFSGTLNATIKLRFSINGTEQAQGEIVRKLGTGGDVGDTSTHAYYTLAANDIVTVEVASDGISSTFLLEAGTLSVTKLK